MSEEQLKAFLERVKVDTSLQDKIKAAADPDAVFAIAKEAGFIFSADDLNKAQSEILEMSEEDLEAISGGKVNTAGTVNTIWKVTETILRTIGRACDMRVKEDVSLMTTTGEVNNELTSMAVAVRSLKDVCS
jgi:predicted ribosomally synthesized peptide with nif11-like leader